MGGASKAQNGIICNPNIPSEEVFTTPHAYKVDGTVSSTKPLSYQGTLIDNIKVTFKDGKIIEAHASKGEEVLQKVLKSDEGASRIGEVALVPHSSPISQSGIIFYNTLFDENAASHIALGQCYSKCFKGDLDLSKDEKRRTTALMLAINAYRDFIIKDANMLEKTADLARRNEGPALRPATFDEIIIAAARFDQFIDGKTKLVETKEET